METKTRQPKKHIGRNFRRLREIMGVKQEAVAHKMDVTQQTISNLEQKETVNDDELNKMAEALGVTKEAIQNFDEESVVYNIVTNNDQSSASNFNYNCTINPIDKWVEAIEENKRLYEKLLKSEQEKVALLKDQLGKK
ncbi:MAG: helix-turn-helix transcriptional regulator [Cytophagales bacterium]|nr:helix-turn-helix transcriptional regulator [Cytophagales bacterium]